MTKKLTGIHEVVATKGGQSIRLHFADYFEAYDTATQLMAEGFVVKSPHWPIELFHSQVTAMATVRAFFR